MNANVYFFTEIIKQTLGIFLSMAQVNTSAGQGMLKFVDFLGALADLVVRGFLSLGSFFGGLFG